MALYKEIVQSDGVPTNYHRILYLHTTINRQNSITVLSYVNESTRDNEKNSILNQPYQKAVTYELDYDPAMTISTAYEWLKTLPQFEGAVDV